MPLTKLPSLSNVEALILELLTAESELYGLELVRRSNGHLKRGTIYTTLGRLEEKGFVTSRLESAEATVVGGTGCPRRIYRCTDLGSTMTIARVFVELQHSRELAN
jgi:DNA-binding PadR family transcriptional regulator